jgi:hypothetical protein
MADGEMVTRVIRGVKSPPRDSSVGIATRLRAGRLGFWGSIPGGS